MAAMVATTGESKWSKDVEYYNHGSWQSQGGGEKGEGQAGAGNREEEEDSDWVE